MRNILKKGHNWDELRQQFRWHIPEHFNIAERCCDSWAARAPDQIAIIDVDESRRGTTWSYGQLKTASDALAASLRARGVQKGARVAVLLPQSPF